MIKASLDCVVRPSTPPQVRLTRGGPDKCGFALFIKEKTRKQKANKLIRIIKLDELIWFPKKSDTSNPSF